jgi:hypothetical protein
MGRFNRLIDCRIERLHVLFSHEPGLRAQWGQSLAIRSPEYPSRCLVRAMASNASPFPPG